MSTAKTVRTCANSKFRVNFVVRDLAYADESSDYHEIKGFCKANQIPFVCRLFNSLEIDDDCHFIERLPAIHIYYSNEYLKTIHLSENTVFSVQREIQKHKDKQLIRKRSLTTRIKIKILGFLRS